MNKAHALEQIIIALERDLAALQAAVKVAHESATHGESVAENKYDTRGLEAAYLAHGQAKRAEEIDASLQVYEDVSKQTLVHSYHEAGISCLVQLEDQDGLTRWLWVGEEAGGLQFEFDDKACTIITPKSPLGAALIGRQLGDIFELRVGDNLLEYEVISLD